MKLIDILVQELPKHGGWPDSVYSISQFPSGGFAIMMNKIIAQMPTPVFISPSMRMVTTLTGRMVFISPASSTKPRWLLKMTAGLSGVVGSVRCTQTMSWTTKCKMEAKAAGQSEPKICDGIIA